MDIESRMNEIFERIKGKDIGPLAVFQGMRGIAKDLIKDRDQYKNWLAEKNGERDDLVEKLADAADEITELRAWKEAAEKQEPCFYSVHRKDIEPSNAVCFDDLESANKYANTNYNLVVSALYDRQIPSPQAVPDGWSPLTNYGQIKIGDWLSFNVGDKFICATAKEILNAGKPDEEIVYNRKRNHYFITSLAIIGQSSHKHVMVHSGIMRDRCPSHESEHPPVEHSLATSSEPVWDLFGLTYASWLVWPRVVMQAMPIGWQRQFSRLAQELNERYPYWEPDGDLSVTLRVNGKLAKLPESLCNYRRPSDEYRRPSHESEKGDNK